MLGIFQIKEALSLAESKNLDLVRISPNAVPPVCKITDYGKSVFEQAKKEKEARKKQKTVSLKEVRLSAVIEEHDFDFKAKNAMKFLQDGDKVKISIRFKGRQMKFTESGKGVLDKFAETLKDVGLVEKAPLLMGRSMFMIMNPKNN